jgi:hypothetical protein
MLLQNPFNISITGNIMLCINLSAYVFPISPGSGRPTHSFAARLSAKDYQ